MTELAPVYEPKDYESKWYDFWMQKKLFQARRDSGNTPFTVLMPPPNVTSQLHMGHGTGFTMQDILVRWKRMQGYEALWLPGTDHAGIATQMMVEKNLLDEEGKTKQDLGREEFVKRLWEWKEKYGGMILKQFAAMGFSCDWDRIVFTMDDKLSYAVRRIFVDLFNEGLIYRGERLVNWDPVLRTAISDDEIENKEISGHLWYFHYPVDGTDEKLEIATTRPETMLGDTAVAVHPDDERYKHIVGKTVTLPLVGRKIPVVADDYVKSDFGSGCVKITPAHDPNDFDIGKRHDLPVIDIMNDDATLNENVPERFRGLDRFKARKEVLKALKEEELFLKEEPHKHTVPHSERSKDVIEPKPSMQWYVDMQTLAKPAIEVAKSGQLRFHPEMWKKTYLHWLENIQDWCISRQLWWGHRIPIWYCADCSGISTGMEDPTECHECGSGNIRQDEDVLDTWFSSWLWPLSPFGWPEESKDLKYFYPTDVMVTAPEIIFLWVARMVMVGLKTQGEVPFHDVFLTATVCDKKGRKFSKTLGNGIDPMDVIDKHGTDAVRFTGVHLAPLGGRIKMAEEDFEVGARFVNKIWNAARFLLGHVGEVKSLRPLDEFKGEFSLSEKWLLHELGATADHVNQSLENYRLNDAAVGIYHYIWGSFCDWGIESAKEALSGSDEAARERAASVLVYVLDGILRLASPIMPFVTEEIWQHLPHHPDWDRPESLIVARYPESGFVPSFPDEAAQWKQVQDLIGGIRSVRSQAGISPKTKLEAHVRVEPGLASVFEKTRDDILRLAQLEQLETGPEVERPGQSMVHVGSGYEAYVPAQGLIDIEAEKTRLKNEVTRVEKVLTGLDKKLGNENFTSRAPAEVVQQTREQKENMESQLASLKKNLEALGES